MEMDIDPSWIYDRISLYSGADSLSNFKIKSMSLTIQYIIIAIIFAAAVISVVRKFIPSKSKNKNGCGAGCGCDMNKSTN
ncbi:FeoB-associated Cys-rich membrane protein [Sphingobacterium alimentarium]